MVQLRVFGAAEEMLDVAKRLQTIAGARHVIQMGDRAFGRSLVTADLVDDAVDPALEQVRRLGVPPEDTVLLRMESIGPAKSNRPLASVIWADLLSQAGINARPLARYLVFMVTAGVIAAFGVIYANVTLVVGAMAISPDTLPITAAATALVLRRWRLAARATVSLIAGLGAACLVGGLMTFVLNTLDLLPTGFVIGQGGLSRRPLHGQHLDADRRAGRRNRGNARARDASQLIRRRCDLRDHDPRLRVSGRCGRRRRSRKGERRSAGARCERRDAARRRLFHVDGTEVAGGTAPAVGPPRWPRTTWIAASSTRVTVCSDHPEGMMLGCRTLGASLW